MRGRLVLSFFHGEGKNGMGVRSSNTRMVKKVMRPRGSSISTVHPVFREYDRLPFLYTNLNPRVWDHGPSGESGGLLLWQLGRKTLL